MTGFDGFDQKNQALYDLFIGIDQQVIGTDVDDNFFGRDAFQFIVIHPPEDVFNPVPAKTKVAHLQGFQVFRPGIRTFDAVVEGLAAPIVGDGIPDEEDFAGFGRVQGLNGVVPFLPVITTRLTALANGLLGDQGTLGFTQDITEFFLVSLGLEHHAVVVGVRAINGGIQVKFDVRKSQGVQCRNPVKFQLVNCRL